jgi:hypothetical protein
MYNGIPASERNIETNKLKIPIKKTHRHIPKRGEHTLETIQSIIENLFSFLVFPYYLDLSKKVGATSKSHHLSF